MEMAPMMRFKLQTRGYIGEAVYLLPGRRWIAEGETEEERRNPKHSKSLKQRDKSKIITRIPLQPQCAHWGSFPPGEAMSATAPETS